MSLLGNAKAMLWVLWHWQEICVLARNCHKVCLAALWLAATAQAERAGQPLSLTPGAARYGKATALAGGDLNQDDSLGQVKALTQQEDKCNGRRSQRTGGRRTVLTGSGPFENGDVKSE